MIYTVTFNPSIDYLMNFDKLEINSVNRSTSESYFVGGKGINVSIILKRLGIQSTALGFTAGFTGEYIENTLKFLGINTDFVKLQDGFSRINVKLQGCTETELNGVGPIITEHDVMSFLGKIKNIADGDTLILSGSVPKNLGSGIYKEVLNSLKHKKIHIVVDATGDLLLNTLEYKPFLIKPNEHEIHELFGTDATDTNSILAGANKLQKLGAENVLVSLGEKGALLLCTDGSFTISAPKGNALNTVGAGDSMVAGFIGGWSESKSFEKALRLGVACGSATAFSQDLATSEKISEIFSITEQPNILV